jgi:hypothetical protein
MNTRSWEDEELKSAPSWQIRSQFFFFFLRQPSAEGEAAEGDLQQEQLRRAEPGAEVAVPPARHPATRGTLRHGHHHWLGLRAATSSLRSI